MAIISGVAQSSLEDDFYDVELPTSLRFTESAGTYLSTRNAIQGRADKWTFSTHIKLSKFQPTLYLLADENNRSSHYLGFTDHLFRVVTPDYNVASLVSVGSLTSWFHLLVVFDSTLTSGTDRLQIRMDGLLTRHTHDSILPALNDDPPFKSTHALRLGEGFDGYLADTYFIDGEALDKDAFGTFKSRVWTPVSYTGDVGPNGFHLQYRDPGHPGKDSSSFDKPFVATILSQTDITLDSPTNNYCHLNPYLKPQKNGCETLSANLALENSSTSGSLFASFPIPAHGQWYFEVFVEQGVSSSKDSVGVGTYSEQGPVVFVEYASDGLIYRPNDNYNTGHTWTTGDIIGVRVDLSRDAVTFSLNGVDVGAHVLENTLDLFIPYCKSSGTKYVVNFGQDSSFLGQKARKGNKDHAGQGDFFYKLPDQCLALCAFNLPAGQVSPVAPLDNLEVYNAVRWAISPGFEHLKGLAFTPDLVLFRAVADRTHQAYGSIFWVVDSVRGAGKEFSTASKSPERSSNPIVTSLDTDGLTYKDPNDGDIYLFCCWGLNTSAKTLANDQTDIAVTLKANPAAGLSIISWMGDGTATAIRHGLDSIPEVLIVKNRDDLADCLVLTTAIQGNKLDVLSLNSSLPGSSASPVVPNALPDKTRFPLTSALNISGKNYIAYCIKQVEWFSKIGCFTGATNRQYVYTGFKPSFVVVKDFDHDNHWAFMSDQYSSLGYANPFFLDVRETINNAGTNLLFMHDGFFIQSSASYLNAPSHRYIYLAFASYPLKFPIIV